MFDVFEREVEVIRQGTGDYVDGIYTKIVPDTYFTIKAVVQPINGDLLKITPDGYQNSVSYVLYTVTKLLTAKNELKNPDIVIIDDERFLVIKVENWTYSNTCIDHYRILVAKENFNEFN